ncbi:FG-GAP repeat domain-containing protein [Streptomyces uncialis]|uniref:FG-GAP repeat domain-containing protein n=1 Tax=Streptomyces uncialis TaxID=1048205 RepID=UPI00380C9C12
MSSEPPPRTPEPDPPPPPPPPAASDSGSDPAPLPRRPSRLRRARDWYDGLAEIGKVTLIAAVITTVGGGVFGAVNAGITVLADGDKDEKPGAQATPTSPPAGRASGPDPGGGGSDTRLSDCTNSRGQWRRLPVIPQVNGFAAGAQRVDFADIDGNGRDDFLVVDAGTGAVKAWENQGTKSDGVIMWGSGSHLTTGVLLDPRKEHVDFADIDGDGFDDYLVVNGENGSVRAKRNHGGRLSGTEWKAVSTIFDARVTRTVFADVDGDERDDYLALQRDSGRVDALLGLFDGSGSRSDPKRLEGVVTVDPGEGERLTFHNADCDRRADALISDENGPLSARMNLGLGSEGKIDWSEEKQIASGDELDSTQYRDFADLDGDGRADSLWVNRTNGEVTPWINQGGD